MRLSPRPFLFSFVAWIFLSIAGFSDRAYSGFVIEQAVSFDSAGKTSEYQFIWRIQGSEFRLDTIRDGEKKHFVFNGRVFYICGRLGPSQMEVVKKFDVSDSSVLLSLERGACQELPMDYGVRFLLSPFEAIGSIDVTGGLGTSVGLSPVRFTKLSESVDLPGATCTKAKREYELTDRSEPKFSRKVSEIPCLAANIIWRPGISRQLGMALLRSPGGQPSFAAMNQDIKDIQGFTLMTSGEMVGMDNFGKSFSSKFKVSAKGVQEKKLSSVELGRPKNFDLIDTRALTLKTPVVEKSSRTDAVSASGSTGGGATGLDMLVKMMILGGNPAAALIEAIRKESPKETK